MAPVRSGLPTPTFAHRQAVSLAARTTLELGGPAALYTLARTEADVAKALAWADRHGVPALVLGGGSNLVVSDEGFDGLVVEMGLRGVAREGTTVWAAAGEPWDDLVAATVARGLVGLECLSGIPGSVGATPIQNVGAYGREVSELVAEVRALDRATGAVVGLGPEACGFGYRSSRFKRDPAAMVVLSVRFALGAPGTPVRIAYPELRARVGGAAPGPAAVRAAVLAIRRAKSMVLERDDPNRRSVGSFFTNPVVSRELAERVIARALDEGRVERADQVPCFPVGDQRKLSAAWLIDRAGVRRGERRGAVGVSSRHTLALVHHGGGSTAELLALAGAIRDRVCAVFGVELVPEPTLVGAELPRRSER